MCEVIENRDPPPTPSPDKDNVLPSQPMIITQRHGVREPSTPRRLPVRRSFLCVRVCKYELTGRTPTLQVLGLLLVL